MCIPLTCRRASVAPRLIIEGEATRGRMEAVRRKDIFCRKIGWRDQVFVEILVEGEGAPQECGYMNVCMCVLEVGCW